MNEEKLTELLSPYQWEKRKGSPIEVYQHTFVSWKDFFYLYPGKNPNDSYHKKLQLVWSYILLNFKYRYHVPSEQWELIEVTDEPPLRYGQCGSVYDDKLFIYSGLSLERVFLTDLWYLDLYNHKWSKIQQFQYKGRRVAGNVLVNNRWYIIGGDTTDECRGDESFFYINMLDYSVKQLDDLPFGNVCQSVCEINGKIYCYGGIGSRQVNELHMYDIESNTWNTLTPNKICLSSFACIAWKEKMFIFGGYDGFDYQNDTYIYDKNQDKWSIMNFTEKKPKCVCYPQGIIYKGEIYIHGGYSGSFVFDDLVSLRIDDYYDNLKLIQKVKNSKLQNINFHFL